MVLSTCLEHCESLPGSCDECSTAPGGCRPLDKPACRLPVNYTHRRHLLFTQPES